MLSRTPRFGSDNEKTDFPYQSAEEALGRNLGNGTWRRVAEIVVIIYTEYGTGRWLANSKERIHRDEINGESRSSL